MPASIATARYSVPAWALGQNSGRFWAARVASFEQMSELLETRERRLLAAGHDPYSCGWLAGALEVAEGEGAEVSPGPTRPAA